MRPALAAALVLALAGPAAAQPKSAALTPAEIADGWLMLFDGETTFGWKVEGTHKLAGGVLELGNGKDKSTATFTSAFTDYDAVLEAEGPGQLAFVEGTDKSESGIAAGSNLLTVKCRVAGGGSVGGKVEVGPDKVVRNVVEVETAGRSTIRLAAAPGGVLKVKSFKLKPHGAKPLFNGKDLSGWQVNQADPKRTATKFEVTKAGELAAKNGPGDLRTEKAFGNFVFQAECKTNGKWLNSGVFFRCVPDQYQNGYEAQIQNAYLGDDRTKPIDFGTGAIYRRVPARKVVSNDHEWFTLTVLADGPHVATWVNGYQTVDWTDDRKPADNPRQGLRTAPGHLSIQGHDPTTDLLFRRLRIAELGEGGKKN